MPPSFEAYLCASVLRSRTFTFTPGDFLIRVHTMHVLDAEQNVSTQVLFAYRMCTGELAGPAGKLSRSLDGSPLLQNTNPWDILNTLRPLKAKVGQCLGPVLTYRSSRVDIGHVSQVCLRTTSVLCQPDRVINPACPSPIL